MMRGQKPETDAQRLLKGKPARDAFETSGRLVCPSWLDEESKSEWKRVVPDLVQNGVAKTLDRGVLVAYCRAWSLLKQAARTIVAEGLQVTTKYGTVRHPAVLVELSAHTAILKAADQLGLTPTARIRLGGSVKPKQKDKSVELDDFIAGKGNLKISG